MRMPFFVLGHLFRVNGHSGRTCDISAVTSRWRGQKGYFWRFYSSKYQNFLQIPKISPKLDDVPKSDIFFESEFVPIRKMD